VLLLAEPSALEKIADLPTEFVERQKEIAEAQKEFHATILKMPAEQEDTLLDIMALATRS